MTLFFYQAGHLSSDIGAHQRRIVRAGGIAIAQHDLNSKSIRQLRTDRINTVLGELTNASQQNYSAYGYCVNPTSTSALAFTGQRYDALSGCYPLGNGLRNYNPILMRFTQFDAASPLGRGGLNGYTYCSGDPINRVDWNGRWPSLPTWLKKPMDWLSEKLFSTPSALEDSIPLTNVTSETDLQRSPASTSPRTSRVYEPSTDYSPSIEGETHAEDSGLNAMPLPPSLQSNSPPLTPRQKTIVATGAAGAEFMLAAASYKLAHSIMIPTHPNIRHHRTLHENYLGPIAGAILLTGGTVLNFFAVKALGKYVRTRPR
ncbi:RHS repeat-associated core domain-containing protein [Pseudomonas urethralis]|uniref:RHS repeat-associated core domain-containing protein n=1 Tax=Pseudomonas urethralis TaxID=2740517 RepID=UPI0015965752|nr:RHS repeat-associated core domain-containing protein [Pseudomonas urethralis]